jgi:hypothetical protein
MPDCPDSDTIENLLSLTSGTLVLTDDARQLIK